MAVNRDKPDRWRADIARSVDLYNAWFMTYAPKAFRETRAITAKAVREALRATDNLTNVRLDVLRRNPGVLPCLRMSTCPPLARDRLIGLAQVPKSMVERMEKAQKLPAQSGGADLDTELRKIGAVIEKLADRDILTWLDSGRTPTEPAVRRAATIIADRLCGATADPLVRNAQEARQLKVIGHWLKTRGYRSVRPAGGASISAMQPGTFAFRLNVRADMRTRGQAVNIPVDAVVMPKKVAAGGLPVLIEAKSAGDFTNVNKRRKEEAKKVDQLRRTYGDAVCYVLFLCGYFDSGYLGYEAAEGIDWVWEHRINDLAEFGL